MNQMNFLKIDDIQGESKFQGHTQEIDVISWNWGFATASSLNTADNASRTLETVTFTFKKVTEDYTQTKADGSAGSRTSASYDIAHSH